MWAGLTVFAAIIYAHRGVIERSAVLRDCPRVDGHLRLSWRAELYASTALW